jgi:hypothetical protein
VEKALLFELRAGLVEFVLVDVDLDAGGADGKQALLAFAEVSDDLLGVISALLDFYRFEGGLRRRLLFILHYNKIIKGSKLWKLIVTHHLNSFLIL